jgi:hypothetical protein
VEGKLRNITFHTRNHFSFFFPFRRKKYAAARRTTKEEKTTQDDEKILDFVMCLLGKTYYTFMAVLNLSWA